MFVTFEGLDGSGKSTQAELLTDALRESGRRVVSTREPGGTPLGEQIREVLLNGEGASAWAEAALFAAARAELVERVIAPAIADGAVVVCDRYLDSSLAYQGIARGLGVDRVLEMNLLVIRGHLPDRTYLLHVEPDESARRVGDDGDRIERAGADFRRRIDEAYRLLARTFPERIEWVDGNRPAEEISELILADLRPNL